MSPSKSGTIEQRYKRLEEKRQPWLDRAQECAKYTLRWVCSPDDTTGEKFSTPYQSIGAEGVMSLASRLTTVVLPPNAPPFRLHLPRTGLKPDVAEDYERLEAELSRVERSVLDEIEALGDRAAFAMAAPHLIVTGNVLLRVSKDGSKVFPLKSYVCRRDESGKVFEIIVKEKLAEDQLPEGFSDESSQEISAPREDKAYDLYTSVERTPDEWVIRQELKGRPVGKLGHEPLEYCSWLPLRLYQIPGEDYGRGHVEFYLGDHQSLENLTCAVVQASGAAAKTVFLVHPGSMTNIRDLQEAPNLGFVSGQAQDLDVLHLDKLADFQIARSTIDQLTQRLSRAYLLRSAIQRDAERVTAAEIRYMAQELETTLGGLYSSLAQEWQRPYVRLRMHYMEKAGLMPPILNDIDVEIVTGIDALGRGQDASRLLEYGQSVFGTLPAQAVMQYINVPSYLRSLAAAMGIDDITILKSPEEVQQEQQQSQQQALLQQVAPNAVNQLGGLARDAASKTRQP